MPRIGGGANRGVIYDGGRRVMGLICCRSSSLRYNSPASFLFLFLVCVVSCCIFFVLRLNVG